jgi:conjugal transfer ATP-binding protein TraC
MLMKKKKTNTSKENHKDIFDNVDGISDLLMPDSLIEREDHMYLGYNRYSRTYTISYPRLMFLGFLNEFFSLGSVDISTYIENIPDGYVIKSLTNKITVMQSNINIQLNKGNIVDYGEQQAVADLEALREAIQTNKDRMSNARTLITVWGRNPQDLDDRCGLFEDICARKSVKARVLVCDQKKAFISSLPYMNMKLESEMRNVTTGAIACLVPVGNTELYHPKGSYFGENVFTKSDIYYDNFIGPPHLTNPHMFISGIAGAGKSVTLKCLSARLAAAGQWVVILDPENEYEKLIKMLGGQYITIKAGEKSGINPFELEVETDDKGHRTVDIYGKLSELREMLSLFCEKFRGNGLIGYELTAVEEIIKKLYSERGITKDADSLYKEVSTQQDGKFYTGKVKKELPTLNDLRLELSQSETTKELAELLKIITRDGSLSMFDCQTSIDLNKKIIGINLKHLTDEFMKFFATVNLLSWLWAKFGNYKYKDILKSVVVDEGWLFARYEHSVRYLEEISRRGRKYKISLKIASQMISEFLQSESGKAIIHMCATKFIMKQDPSIADEVAEFFKLSSSCTSMISSFPSGYGLLKTETETVVTRIEVNDFELPYVTT